MHSVGFEPTHPKILRPERSALDRSAKNARMSIYILCARLAQMVERMTLNHVVAGSIPAVGIRYVLRR